MTAVLIVVVVSLAVLGVIVKIAPYGYEDEQGFHYGSKGR